MIRQKRLLGHRHVLPYEPGGYHADASSIGLKPGEWPQEIQTDMGNSENFVKQYAHQERGRLVHVDYVQRYGSLRLRLWNT